MRVVFYSTRNEEDVCIFQGIAELVSHTDSSDGVVRRGIGSYGYGQNSIRDLNQEIYKFCRKETGTDIIIAGYKISPTWKTDLMKSVLRNFWYAIYRNDLSVEIDDLFIDKNSLEERLIQYFFSESFKEHVKPVGNPLQYYKAVKEGRQFKATLKTIGEVEFWFNEVEEPMNYVSMMRKSHMAIYSKRFNFPGQFAGVFLCDNKEGNQELRKMEPPAHDEWIPERNMSKGSKIIDEIITFIRDCLRSLRKQKESGILDIPELYKYLPDDDGAADFQGAGNAKFDGTESDDETSSRIQKKEAFDTNVPITPYKIAVINKRVTGSKGDGFQLKKGVKKIMHKGGGGGLKEKGNSIEPKFFKSRTFLTSISDELLEYRIVLKSTEDVNCDLKIFAIGEDVEAEIAFSHVSDEFGEEYFFSKNRIQNVSIRKEVSKKLKIKILSKIKYSLKIELHDLQ